MRRAMQWLFIGEKIRSYHGNEVRDASRFATACMLFLFSVGPVCGLVWLGLVIRALLRLSR